MTEIVYNYMYNLLVKMKSTLVYAFCPGFGDHSSSSGERENSGAQCGDIIRQVLHHPLHMLILALDFAFVFMLKQSG